MSKWSTASTGRRQREIATEDGSGRLSPQLCVGGLERPPAAECMCHPPSVCGRPCCVHADYGVVCFWGLTVKQEQDILSSLAKKAQQQPLPPREVSTKSSGAPSPLADSNNKHCLPDCSFAADVTHWLDSGLPNLISRGPKGCQH